ncbi:MAG: hypothetical protein KAW94_06820 [Candidatus Thorarchaeota archaeon]|nr:hypothetical protein [Candidatus Thorarchaeota archaeon]
MNEEGKTILLEDALKAAEGALSRIALLHISFSKMLVDEFGEEKGKDLIAKAIIEYGHRIVDRMKKGLPELTDLGLLEESGENDEGKSFIKGCVLAKVFKEQDALDVGYMYCYVDAAKLMAWQPEGKTIHLTCEACGDEVCTFDILPTTEEEQQAFAKRDSSWQQVDPKLFEFKG